MILELINLKSRAESWSKITLSLCNGSKESVPQHAILETDQIAFKLYTKDKYCSAKLLVESLEISGTDTDESGMVFEWMPKRNTRFGHESLFLHYFGIAELAVELVDEQGDITVFVFDSIEIYGRKITAERATSMLSYISTKVDEHILTALSPTTFSSKLVRNGVTPAEVLSRLEKTVEDVEVTIKNIILRPITSLRTSNIVIHNPTNEDVDDCGVEWITEFSGLSYQVGCEHDSIFHSGIEWRGMPEVLVTKNVTSTDIYENHLVIFYLNKLLTEGKRILNKCIQMKLSGNAHSTSINAIGYVSFFDVSHKNLNSITAKYEIRARTCVNKLEKMISSFNKHIPVSSRNIGRLMLTEKIKANRHYLLFVKNIKEWVDCRDINWLEHMLFSNIHSTPVLFEYYSIILVDSWLKNKGDNQHKGLFSGKLHGENVKLYYEPSYPHPSYGESANGIWSCDIKSKRGRRPDIVIDVDNDNSERRKLYVFDAKCRNEYDVINYSLPECSMKYGYGLRDKNGRCPVQCVVILHPKPMAEQDNFVDFYANPFDFKGKTPAYPIIGAQRLNISGRGAESGLHNFLNDLLILSN
ncbi:nuclease domain-containing protein [Pectobacterium carotovorum]|uniref:nuclease domain-containing protein n=1 Tax=Pectobacterium carotovorum TaxID=554 RepID=UPI002116DFE7|nr:nuclease domain-containing protein [Pectobacterium carotovorum]MCQ8230708.1 nuclease domain-containing protein [Pectobacterium carotovorum]